MKVDIINSGSKGNCAVIDDTIIIDAGWNCSPEGQYVLLTHNHTDHTKHLDKVSGRPIFCLDETAERLKDKFPYVAFSTIDAKVTYRLKIDGDFGAEFFVTPWSVKHDVPCVGFDIFKAGTNERIFFATDFNSIEDEEGFIKCLKNKDFDAIYIEGNNTLGMTDFVDVYFSEDGQKPKDEFHRRKSFQNHCNIDYLIDLFTRAGYSEDNRFTEPVTLLHKSSYYYQQNVKRIADLCRIANIINPLY